MINSEAKRDLIRHMVRKGETTTSLGRALSTRANNINWWARRDDYRTKGKPTRYEYEYPEHLEAAMEAGREAAKRGMSDEACPYWHDEIALRCHWMAGYYDEVKEMQV